MNKRVQSALERAMPKEGERQTHVASYVLPARERNGEGARITRTGCRGGYVRGRGGSPRRRLGKGIGRRKRWSEREAKGQGRKIPATSRLICSSEHLYVSRARIYFSCVRASASTFARIYGRLWFPCVLYTVVLRLRAAILREAPTTEWGEKGKEKVRERTTQEPRAVLLFVLFRAMMFFWLGCPLLL